MTPFAMKKDIKLALVVDDSPMQCKVLGVLLKEEGYRVFTANDGARGVDMYIKYKPDLVLMDINMPVMNGYEAARKIKSFSQTSLCPLIFITSMDSDQAFIESIDAGGDGILVRPFSPEVFKAKIKSIQRISDLYGQVKRLQQEQQQDAELAEQLMSGVIESRNYALDRIGIVKKPAALFSGDIQLTALSPNGDINILLGDFTGHGLRSSIGAIPLSETFRAMTKKGFSLLEIIAQVNRQLHNLLPPDLFLGAAFVTISSHDSTAYIFNAGLPDCYIYNGVGEIKHKILSSHPPMGVLPTLIGSTKPHVVVVEETDRIVLISDGIVEARNDVGEMFEFERFEEATKQGVLAGNISESVLDAVNEFCQNMPQEDDISLIDIPCSGWQQTFTVSNVSEDTLINSRKQKINAESPAWTWKLKLTGKRLAEINPIPMAMSQIQDIEGNAEHWQSLFTILTELFVNSLDHGVLGLSSDLKNSPEGFVEYFTERDSRLQQLDNGFVDIELNYFPFDLGGKLVVKILDSGTGFDHRKKHSFSQHELNDKVQLCGRGIELVKQLCESMDYYDGGRAVEAAYVWSS